MTELKIPVGISDFGKIRANGYYYIDKTGLISELLKTDAVEVTLITRPRRFGKTLGISMLAYFFNIRKDSRALFKGLEVARCPEVCDTWMNQWPTLFLTFKDIDGLDFESAKGMLRNRIARLCREHIYLEKSKRVNEYDRKVFSQLADTVDGRITDDQLKTSIALPGLNVNDKFEVLLSGGVIQEQISEDMTYDIANSSESNLWSILYLTGYLTQAVSESGVEGKTPLRIPNEEVKTIFADTVVKWFADNVTAMDRTELFRAWWEGESRKLTEMVTDILFETISYFDYKEDYYHAFLAGLFIGAGYQVSSNQEQGTGRSDVIVKDRKNRRAIIIEIKRSKKEESMEKDCEIALAQIHREQYARNLLKGYQNVLCYGAAFFEKSCHIAI